MPFKDLAYLELWQSACLAAQIIKAILLESIMRNISAKIFGIYTSAVWYNFSFAFHFNL